MPSAPAVGVTGAGESAAIPVGIDIRVEAVTASRNPQHQQQRARRRHGEVLVGWDCHLAAGSGAKAAKAKPTRATTPAPMNRPFATVASV